jgi:hypothetical protein
MARRGNLQAPRQGPQRPDRLAAPCPAHSEFRPLFIKSQIGNIRLWVGLVDGGWRFVKELCGVEVLPDMRGRDWWGDVGIQPRWFVCLRP